MRQINDKLYDNFNNNVKSILDHYHMSQMAFAKSIDISVARVNAVLNGRGKPTLDFVIICAEYFNISIDNLLYTTINPETTKISVTN